MDDPHAGGQQKDGFERAKDFLFPVAVGVPSSAGLSETLTPDSDDGAIISGGMGGFGQNA